jgi:outer membrane biosynthesis protein TonB
MKRSILLCLTVVLVTAHRLPAPSQEVQESPTPISSPAASLPKPKPSYRPQKEAKHLSGSITNRGVSPGHAIGTPLGRYQKMVYDAIGARWYQYVTERADLMRIGTAHVSFLIDQNGQIKNLKVIQNTSNEAFANICLRSILEIKLPPIPKEVADSLPPEGLDQDISFTMFPNKPTKPATTPSPVSPAEPSMHPFR